MNNPNDIDWSQIDTYVTYMEVRYKTLQEALDVAETEGGRVYGHGQHWGNWDVPDGIVIEGGRYDGVEPGRLVFYFHNLLDSKKLSGINNAIVWGNGIRTDHKAIVHAVLMGTYG